MKKLILAFLLLTTFGGNAQSLSNPNFENWSPTAGYDADTMPLNWWSFYCNTVHPTNDSYSGIYASRVQGWFACGIAQGIMVNGTAPDVYGSFMDAGTPFTAKPAAISGYYKYTDVAPGDSAEVTIILKRFNSATMQRDTVSYSTQTLAASAGYTMFTVSMNDLMPGVMPDSIIIMFNSSKHLLFDFTTMVLPSLYVDRIIMPETPTGIAEHTAMFNSNVFPSPFSGTATLVINAGQEELKTATVSIFDLSGKMVAELNNIESNSVQISENGLAKGAYVYKVSSANTLLSQGKFIIR